MLMSEITATEAEMDGPPVQDWPDKARLYWSELATRVGASPAQAKFAWALATGHSQSSAARVAGYSGEPRTQGYSTARTKRVKSMLVLAESDGWQSPSDTVDEPTKQRLLNTLMRSTDPQVRLRAIELADRRRERELERNATPYHFDPIVTLNELAEIDPMLARWLAISHGLPWKLPPASVERALVRLEEVRRQILADADTAMRSPMGSNGPIEAKQPTQAVG